MSELSGKGKATPIIFTLEPLRAQEGDCLLLHFGTKDSPSVAVIDGGPARVYEESLRPRLEEIRRNLKVKKLDIDVVMVSHIDADHIVGVKKLFAELQKEIDLGTPNPPFRARRLWHNTFNDILGDDVDAYYQTFTSSFTASAGGEPTPKVVKDLRTRLSKKSGLGKQDLEAVGVDIGSILAGHADGRALRDSHAFLFDANQIAALNRPFTQHGTSTLITADLTKKTAKVGNLSFKVVAPLQADIDALQADFDKYIKKNGLTAEAVLAAYADRSIPNLSSIVCLVTSGKKSILLTGDARGDHILEGLEKTKLLKSNDILTIDVLKVPHHGSIRNVNPDFFERIIASTYVFSGNGKHGNPDRETLELLMDTRGKKAEYDIVLTYDVKTTDTGRRNDFKKHDRTWKANRDSLASLFAEREEKGFKFRLSAGEDGKIDLGTAKVSW